MVFANGISAAISEGTPAPRPPSLRPLSVRLSGPPSRHLHPLPPTSPILLDLGQPHLLQCLPRYSPQMNSHGTG